MSLPDLIGRPIDCGDGLVGSITRVIGCWHSPVWGECPTVNLQLLGELYRHVYAVKRMDGTLVVDHGLPVMAKARVA